MMKMKVDEEERRAHRGPRWIWRFAVAVRLSVAVGLLYGWRWKGSVLVLRVEVMFWISCGISVVAVSTVAVVAAAVVVGVDGGDDGVSDLPLLSSSVASARA